MGLIAGIVIVVLTATISGALAVPLGIFVGLHPFTVYVLTVATATTVAWALLLGGHRFRGAIADRLGHGEHHVARTRAAFDRHGIVGLGLIGPLFPGVVTSSISSVAMGIESKRLGRWLTVGIACWFAVYTVVWWAVERSLFG